MQARAIVDAMLDLDPPQTGRQLFTEDFDASPPPPEPEVIEPTFSAAEIDAARRDGYEAGHAAALAETAVADRAAIRDSVAEIRTQMENARESATHVAVHCAESVAHVLFDSLRVALPALTAKYGEAELAAVIRVLAPALAQEPAITVRVHPAHSAALGREFERLDGELAKRCHVVGVATMAQGDVQVTWRNGSATREIATLWQDVAEALGATGLIKECPDIKEEMHVA